MVALLGWQCRAGNGVDFGGQFFGLLGRLNRGRTTHPEPGANPHRRSPHGYPAKRFNLGLVWKVRNDALVGLQASQNIGSHQIAERTARVLGLIGEAFDVG